MQRILAPGSEKFSNTPSRWNSSTTPLLEDVLKSTFYGWDKKKISGDDVKRETELEKSSESKSWKEDLPLIETIRKLDSDQLCPEKIRKDLRLTIITLGTQLDARCVAMTEDGDLLTLRVDFSHYFRWLFANFRES